MATCLWSQGPVGTPREKVNATHRSTVAASFKMMIEKGKIREGNVNRARGSAASVSGSTDPVAV